MARTTLVRDFLWRVSGLLVDDDPQFAVWGEQELVSATQDGIRAIAKYLPRAFSQRDTLKLAPGALQSIAVIAEANCKPGDGRTLSGDLHGAQLLTPDCNMGVDGETPGRAIRISNRADFDAARPNWRDEADPGGVVKFVFYDPQTPTYFEVFPPVRASGGEVWIRTAYVEQPATIPNDGDLYANDGDSSEVLPIDDTYIDDLMNYVLARAHQKEHAQAKPQMVSLHTGLFTASLNALVLAAYGYNPNLKRLPFAPQPMGAAS